MNDLYFNQNSIKVPLSKTYEWTFKTRLENESRVGTPLCRYLVNNDPDLDTIIRWPLKCSKMLIPKWLET